MAIITEQISGSTITVQVKSTNLQTLAYDTIKKTLRVTFNNGHIYDYYDLPWEIFTKLRMAESQGRYFNTEISKKYKYTRIQ